MAGVKLFQMSEQLEDVGYVVGFVAQSSFWYVVSFKKVRIYVINPSDWSKGSKVNQLRTESTIGMKDTAL